MELTKSSVPLDDFGSLCFRERTKPAKNRKLHSGPGFIQHLSFFALVVSVALLPAETQARCVVAEGAGNNHPNNVP